ncbi:hemagglutinin repeat-containing protein, partial [Vibrio kasasachensis]|uniref:hemagglutinin repeat-containing protein n=1 Tax=Vibrio kasasachensis TaxID=2910248 RepID=UPI003D0EDE98
VNILAVNDSDYSYFKKTVKKSFGRSKTTIRESYNETVKGSALSGENINISAHKIEGVQLSGGESDIQLVGANLNASENVNLSADGDVVLAAQSYKQYHREESIKKGLGGLSGKRQGSIDDATLLNSANVITGANVNIAAGNDIGVIASNVVAGGNVDLEALDQLLVSAGEELKQAQQWSEKTSFLSGGSLFEMEKKRSGVESKTAKASTIQSGGDINASGGSVKVIGSQLNAQESINAHADTGNVEIVAAKESKHQFSSEEKIEVKLNMDVLKGGTFENGQFKYSIGEATYDKVDEQIDTTTNQSSQLQAGEDIAINAESDIVVEGSNLFADADNSNSGDISLAAKDSITIKEAKDTQTSQRDELHGKAEVSLVVQHQAVEVVKAAKSLLDSKDALEEAKESYKQFKKQITSLKGTLEGLEDDYRNKIPGVAFDDIEELRDLVIAVEGDKEWYVANIALAAKDVVSKSLALSQQAGATGPSIATLGFNAGIHLDIEATETESRNSSTQSVGSNLLGQNIKISSGMAENEQVTVQGSNLIAKNKTQISGNKVEILASKDTSQASSSSKSGSIGASVTVYGAASGINLSASVDKNESESRTTTFNNSLVEGNEIVIESDSDTLIKGANIIADSGINMNIGGDLTIASEQNRASSSSKGKGISAGASLTGGELHKSGAKQGLIKNLDGAGEFSGGNGGIRLSSGRSSSKETVLTSLESGGEININVGNHTQLEGAKIATVDKSGNDLGKVNLETGSIDFVDLSNTHFDQNKNFSGNTGFSIGEDEEDGSTVIDWSKGKTSLVHSNTSHYSKTKTLATVGQGNITVRDEESDLVRLNRDIEKGDKALYSVDREQGDFDVTIDHRLFSKDGWEDIALDLEKMGDLIANVSKVVEDIDANENLGGKDTHVLLVNNQKASELIRDLKHNPEHKELVEALGSEDGDTAASATKQLAQLALDKYGLDLKDLNFYDGSKTDSSSLKDTIARNTKAATVTDKNSEHYQEVFVDGGDGAGKKDILQSVGEEIIEVVDLQSDSTRWFTDESEATQEAITQSFGEMLTSQLENKFDNVLTNTSSNQFKQSLKNSSAVKHGTKTANQVGSAKVDYRMYRYKEAKVMDNIRGRIDSDKSLTNNQKQQAKVQLSALACASVKCAEQVPENDPYYKQLTALQDAGEKLQADGASLKGMLGEDAEGLFEHDWLDSVNDTVLKHDEGITKGGAIVNVVSGYGGAAASAIGGAAICTGGVTCAAGVALATLGTDAGLEQGREGLNKLNEDYSSTIGESTFNSASTETHEGDVNPVGDLAIDAAVGAGTLVLEAVIAKAGGKALDKVVDVVDQAGSGKKAIKDVVTADSNVSSTNLSTSKDGVTSKPISHYLNNTTNPEVREVFVNQAVNVRSEIPEELANKGNLALADVNIPGLPDKMKAFSRFQKGENGFVPLPQGETILKPLSVNKYGVVDGKESFSRVYDGEFKILETTARVLGDNPNATGRIDLFTELKACTSCGGAIQQFRSKYPNIQLNVFTKK